MAAIFDIRIFGPDIEYQKYFLYYHATYDPISRPDIEFRSNIRTNFYPDIEIFRISRFSGYRDFPDIGRPDIGT
jgi:hypothetical protein